jgi:PBP1b-binding outer membrane lipoprotein LpoB
MKTLLAVFAAALLLSGCSIRHDVAKDYPQYLINNQGASQLPSTKAASEYTISPTTVANHYEFRSAMAGYANVWVVQFGQVLDDTLQSHDVQTAFGKLAKSGGGTANDGLLIFDLQSYTYVELGAHVSLKVTYRRGNQDIFSKTYQADGTTQGGKMFWGGAFAMKNAVQQSTKLAVDNILRQLIADLNVSTAQNLTSQHGS